MAKKQSARRTPSPTPENFSPAQSPKPYNIAGTDVIVVEPKPSTQKLQYPLIKEYTLNHIRDPTII